MQSLFVISAILIALMSSFFLLSPQELRPILAIMLCIITFICFVVIILHDEKLKYNKKQSLESFVSSKSEDEVIPTDMAKNVTLYFSTLGNSNISSTTWKNLVSDTRHLKFENVPNIQNNRSLRTLNNRLEGPESRDLGFHGEDDFVFIWHAAFPRVAYKNTSFRHTMLEIYANTFTNIGFRIELEGLPTLNGNMEYFIVYTQGRISEAPYTCKWQIREVLSAPMTYAIIRSGNTISLKIIGIKDFQTFEDAPLENVLLSNKQMQFNTDGSLDADLWAVILIRGVIPPDYIIGVDTYLKDRKNVLNETTQMLIKAQIAAEKMKTCPLIDESICNNECADINDWSNAFDVVLNATPSCKHRLSQYCKLYDNNDSSNICNGCFLGSAQNTEKCKTMKSFLEDGVTLNRQTCSSTVKVLNTNEPSLKKYFLKGFDAINSIPHALTATIPTIPIINSSINTNNTTNTSTTDSSVFKLYKNETSNISVEGMSEPPPTSEANYIETIPLIDSDMSPTRNSSWIIPKTNDSNVKPMSGNIASYSIVASRRTVK
jgi:hypothetical protein